MQVSPASAKGPQPRPPTARGAAVLLPLLLLSAQLLTAGAGCTYERAPVDLRNQDVRLLLIHTADVHSRLFPYAYAPNTPDRQNGLLVLPGACQAGRCTSDTGKSCAMDSECQAFSTANVGGLARMATVIKRERQGAARVLHLDSGDMFQGAPVFNVFSGETEVRSMGLLGVQGMALGNHEFDKGAQTLGLQLMNNGPNFPLLAANYEWADPDDQRMPKLRRFIQPYSIYNVGGLRVGVIGLGNLSSLNSAVEGDNSLGLRALDSKQAVKDLVRIVRPQVDLLVLASHLGPDDDAAVSEEVSEDVNADIDPNMQVAAPGIDLILGGHLHVVYNPPIDLAHYDKDGSYIGRTVIVNSGAFSKFVGVIDLVVHIGDPAAQAESGRRSYIKSYTFHVTPVADRQWRAGDPEDPCDPRIRCTPPHPNNAPVSCPWKGPGAPPRPNVVCIPEDAPMSQLLEPYSVRMKQLLNLGQVYAVVPCATSASTCPKVLRNDPAGGDSQVGNLVAASMRLRRRVEADFGLTNSLGIRADFESGPLTLEQMYNVFPFDNTITTMFLSGDEILQMLDFVAERSAERGCRTQTQVSGIAFTMNCDNRPKSTWTVPRSCAQRVAATAAEKKTWVGSFSDDIAFGDGCRAKDGVAVDYKKCAKLDCFRTYKAAVNDFISVGGSGFVVLKRNTTRFNTGISLRDSLIDYIRGLGADPRYRCAGTDSKWRNIKGVSQGGPYDYSNVTCLLPEVEKSDGRILGVVR